MLGGPGLLAFPLSLLLVPGLILRRLNTAPTSTLWFGTQGLLAVFWTFGFWVGDSVPGQVSAWMASAGLAMALRLVHWLTTSQLFTYHFLLLPADALSAHSDQAELNTSQPGSKLPREELGLGGQHGSLGQHMGPPRDQDSQAFADPNFAPVAWASLLSKCA